MKEFWKHLAWPDVVGSFNLVIKLLDVSKYMLKFMHTKITV